MAWDDPAADFSRASLTLLRSTWNYPQHVAAFAAWARRAVASVGHELLYARIDVAPGPEGTPVLMELELIEPSLFFVQAPPALERLVAGVRQRLLGEHRPPR